MKGVIFSIFNELVEERFGLEMWERLLLDADVDGIYTAADNYDDEDLLSLISSLSRHSDIPVNELVKAFGEYAFSTFLRIYPRASELPTTSKELLNCVHDIIHVEVRKLYPDAETPEFHYEDAAENQLIMKYSSRRKLCALVEGLIDGTAEHFGEEVSYTHTICMHNGHDHCRFELEFAGQLSVT